mgnify:CR=1 FL=1
MAKKENQTQKLFKELKNKDYQATIILGMLPSGDVEVTPSHPNFAVMTWVIDRAKHNLNLVQDHLMNKKPEEKGEGA